MFPRAIVASSLFLILVLPPVLPTGTADTMPTVEEITTFLGYSKSDIDKLYAGEIVSRRLQSGTEKELAVTVAMVLKSPLAGLEKSLREGRIFELSQSVVAVGDLGDAPPSDESFAKLGFGVEDGRMISRLSKVKPGSRFNFSTPEIRRLQSVAKRFSSKKARSDPVVREALNAEYRKILKERLEAYRQGGLSAIAPYDRGGGKSSSPGAELTDQAKRAALMKQKMPEFHRAVLDYPRNGADDIQNQFFWLNKLAQDRPTFVLAHRIYQYKPEKYSIEVYREFYVAHSYNSLHIVVGALPVKEGTLVFYLNRTSTDQVAGSSGGFKRKVGSGMMRKEVVKHFNEIRQDAERGNQ